MKWRDFFKEMFMQLFYFSSKKAEKKIIEMTKGDQKNEKE
jgi:hypothetical protein